MASVASSLLAPAARGPAAPARHDRLAPGPRNAVIGAIVVAHLAGGWAALQVPAVRQARAEAAPLFVDLLRPAPPIPEPPVPTPPPLQPRPTPRKPPPPAPLVTAPPAAAPAPFAAPAPEPEPAPPPTPLATAPALPAPPAPAAPSAPAAPPAPREIPPSAIAYLVLPDIAYPAVSRRLHESGLVVVAVLVGPDGVPREVQVHQSSGHARLDDAAVAGVRRARFKPYTEAGQPLSGWARIPIPFELEP